MAQRQYTVGTEPVLIANNRGNRGSINISMPPVSIASGNTGVVYIGKGFVPRATVGEPDSGSPISQGSQLQDAGQFQGDTSVFKGQWWAVADTTGQIINVDETFLD